MGTIFVASEIDPPAGAREDMRGATARRISLLGKYKQESHKASSCVKLLQRAVRQARLLTFLQSDGKAFNLMKQRQAGAL